ncbi:MAG: mismatch repair protein MutS [Clostridia bacterium]|nr:mismatch repair protein MutS [Clostridia bacterium]
MKAAKQMYERRKENYGKLLQKQKKVEKGISNLRLGVFTAGICDAVFAYLTHSYIVSAAIFVALIVIFLYLVINHERLIVRIKYSSLLLDINNSSLKRMNGEWNKFADAGEDFVNDSHNYSSDLDIFGKNSLFQWINTAKTFTGREKLRDLLSEVIGDSNAIKIRQEAINELAAMIGWRQRFLAEGMATTEKIHNPEELIKWGKESNEFFRKPWVIAFIRICPIVTILLVTAGYIMNKIPDYLPATALLIQFGLISYKVRERYRMFGIFEKYNVDLRVYYKMLRLLEKRKFNSTLINNIKDNIRNNTKQEAFKQVDKLSSIVDSISNRRNLFYIIFNTLTLWDFQSMIALERWKRESGHFLKDWFDNVGRIEAMASLAVIGFENPDFVIPKIYEGGDSAFETMGLGHPLIIENRIHNDVAVDGNVKVLLITGSNMSGKSTLLRTTGINLVLAYAGAPVCATSFRTSIMSICTCMRIKDNLEENISSFYAELLKIKKIVSESQSGTRVFFLLDEIFRGTNSEDRHAGAKVLINKLSMTNSIGLVSTHDLELCDLEQKNDKIVNYHFQEYYEDGKIHFDYKLRQGPSTTRNALHLMRLAGIDVI